MLQKHGPSAGCDKIGSVGTPDTLSDSGGWGMVRWPGLEARYGGTAAHWCTERPEMWPIFEIRHVSKHEFYSLSVFQRTKASQDILTFVKRLLVFCVHDSRLQTSPMFFSAFRICRMCRICGLILWWSLRCNKTTTVCLFLFDDALWQWPNVLSLRWHVILDLFCILFFLGQKCDDTAIFSTFCISFIEKEIYKKLHASARLLTICNTLGRSLSARYTTKFLHLGTPRNTIQEKSLMVLMA